VRDWLLANAFLYGMTLIAAGVLFAGFALVRIFNFDPDTERSIMGWIAILALIATGFIARYALKRIERR
jgi:Co/Zn/Cd efflux system component